MAASTAPAARGPTRTAGIRPSSARTARRPLPGRPPASASDREFFAAHSVAELREQDGPLARARRAGSPSRCISPPARTHYEPIGWDDAFRLIAERLRALPDPNRAVFYTCGRASNEAAFVYQLLARRLGTNNLPDCSNMCHESSGAALTQTLGVGKGTVTLDDIATTPT